MSHTSQTAAILSHLQRGPITALEALQKYSCLRLAARVADLRRAGHEIKSEIVRRGDKRFARYSLAQ